MRRAPSILVCLSLAAASAQAAAAGEAATDCAPSVRLEGTAPAIGELAEALARVGLPPPAPGCAATTVTVVAGPEGLVLDIVDIFGRPTHRVVHTVAGAVALIESRARTETLMALGSDAPAVEEPVSPAPHREPPPPPPPARAEPTTPPPVSKSAVASVAQAPAVPTSLITVALTPETSLSSDGARWFGMVLSVGVTVGPTCLGALLRLKSDVESPKEPTGLPQSRHATDAAVTLELPWRSGSFSIRPGLELGVGHLSQAQSGPAPEIKRPEGQLPASAKPYVLDPRLLDERQRSGLRTGAQLAIAWRFWGRWHLQAAAGLGLSLFAETGPFPIADLMLPGEPRAVARTSLGLRYGGL
jgi:hypothetical protein